MLERLQRLVQTMLMKAAVVRVTGGDDQEAEIQGLGGWSDVAKVWSHYGFKSRPLAGSESILMRLGGIGELISLVIFDRRYSVTLDEGEVAIFDDQGQKVHLKRAGIEVSVPAGKTIKILSGDVQIGPAGQVTEHAPTWEELVKLHTTDNNVLTSLNTLMTELKATINGIVPGAGDLMFAAAGYIPDDVSVSLAVNKAAIESDLPQSQVVTIARLGA